MTDNDPNISKPTNHNFRDLEGTQFGKLIVLSFAGRTKHGATRWLVQCECGVEKVVYRGDLTSGRTISCGHLGQRPGRRHHVVHSEAMCGKQTPEYISYRAAKQRCTTPTNASYDWYGGQGIEFRFSSFQEFLAEVGRRPTAQHSIDRIDNNGHYEHGNIRWATPKEQANNREN